MRKSWQIGIDPGFREAGLIGRYGRDLIPRFFATWHTGPGDEFIRALALSQVMVDYMVWAWEEHDVHRSDATVSIEMHVWRQNPVTHRMQSRLLQELEAGIYAIIAPMHMQMGTKLTLIEPQPSTSKKVLTNSGKAKKEEMVDSFKWWAGEKFMEKLSGVSQHTLETLADAYAHSLVTPSFLKTPPRVLTDIAEEEFNIWAKIEGGLDG